jgi:hypothetical protein
VQGTGHAQVVQVACDPQQASSDVTPLWLWLVLMHGFISASQAAGDLLQLSVLHQ